MQLLKVEMLWPSGLFLKTGYIERAVDFSTSLNCTQVDGIVNLTCLQNVKVENIISNQLLKLTLEDSISGKGLPFVPSLEKPSTNAILSDTPENLLTSMLSSTGPKRSVITGINRDEGLIQLVTNPNYYAGFYTMLKYFIPEETRKIKTEDEIEKDVALIKTQYFNNTPPSITNLDGYIKLFTDSLFGLSTAIFSRKISQVATVYLYHFEFSGLFNIPNPNAIALNITNAVGHSDELGYIFYIPPLNQSTTDASSTSMTTLKRMVKMWTNFAKTGNPTPDGTTDDDLKNIIWTPATNGAYRYLQISSQLKMSENNFEEDAVVFWNKIQNSDSSLILSSCALVLISITFLYIF
uniref:Carboxylesterase type B domain-containing protein n=1 Tax=Clastoptera arizonana TaxID=38151 RepID=A0A1B6CXI0_9HEMI